MNTANDIRFMKRALALAKRGKGRVEPNPMVGAVLVKDGVIVGEGYHQCFGGPHAEINALAAAGERARGATLYVTLEPCSHREKKTPPCTEALIRAGIASVYAAMSDPNPRVAGEGLARLRQAGITTQCGLLKPAAHTLLSAYCRHMSQGKSHVTVKMAMTLDGKIATHTGDSKWITGPAMRAWVHRLRSTMDAVLVGVGTVLADDPQLTSHGKGRNPVRVIVDPQLAIPLKSAVLDTKTAPTILIHNPEISQVRINRLKQMGVLLVPVSFANPEYFKDIVKQLANLSIFRILIEGGGETVAAALKAKVVHEFIQCIAPKIAGGRAAKTPVEGLGITSMSDAIQMKGVTCKKIGHDYLIKGTIN